MRFFPWHCCRCLILFCTCPPLCLGVMYAMPTSVSRDVRWFGFVYLSDPHSQPVRQVSTTSGKRSMRTAASTKSQQCAQKAQCAQSARVVGGGCLCWFLGVAGLSLSSPYNAGGRYNEGGIQMLVHPALLSAACVIAPDAWARIVSSRAIRSVILSTTPWRTMRHIGQPSVVGSRHHKPCSLSRHGCGSGGPCGCAALPLPDALRSMHTRTAGARASHSVQHRWPM